MPRRTRSASARRPTRLDRREIVDTALRLIDAKGLEQLSLRRLATELHVTVAAVYWHVRSKDELLDAVMEVIFSELAPPPCDRGPWTERARELSTWFRSLLLERVNLVFTPAFGKILPYAFMEVGLAGKNILKDAGFTGAELARASRALYWYTFAAVLQQAGTMSTSLPTSPPKLVLERAIDTLEPDEFAAFLEYLHGRSPDDHDALFQLGLGCLLDGLARDLETRRTAAKHDQAGGA